MRPLPTAVEGKDGTLWFASTAAIFSVDPKTLVSLKPPVATDQGPSGQRRPVPTECADRPAKGDERAPDRFCRAGPGSARTRAVPLQLDRVDTEWRDVGTRRQAFYSNLGAGDYRFHVVASNDGRVWSPQEASLGFRIAPTFTQTGWFFALCSLAAIFTIALLLRWRVRQVALRMRWKLDTQLAERDRIARELHDTLLQSTQGLILRFQAITNRMPAGDRNREQMETALERADEVLTEGRDRVRGLRRAAGQRSSLTGAVRTVGEELAADAKVAFRFELSGEEPRLSLEVADEIQRIVSEALLNACRHGKAHAVDLSDGHGSRELVVVVEDDGVGIVGETAGMDHGLGLGLARHA